MDYVNKFWDRCLLSGVRDFSISEMCFSPTAKKGGIKNIAPIDVEKTMFVFLAMTLQPLRDEYGKPIYINSGYRSEELNKAVGGVPASFHLIGQAADITTGDSKGNSELVDILKCNHFEYDRVVVYKGFSFLHVQTKIVGENRHQIIFKQ